MNTKKFQLKNGMKVLFQESHKSPVISVQVWVRTGSADEGKKEEGISHFIEHLVFKGTRKFKVGEIASQIEGAGGELNAYTSFDQTVFYVTMSKNFVDTGLEALAEMMGFPQFDPQEIDNEREVVVEEIKKGQDSLGRRASQLLFSTVYKKHPYGVPVIGFEKNVRSWSAKKIVEYYRSRYSPQNMFLVVAGDFNSAEMKPKVTKFFGEFKKYAVKKTKRKAEPAQKSFRLAVEKSEFEQNIAYLSWRTPKINHKDIPALDVLAMIMGQGDSSRLVHKLRIDSPVVNSVGSSVFSARDPGFFTVSMGYKKENLKEALDGITQVMTGILKGEITPAELHKALTNLESENLYGVETVDGLSRKIGDAEFLFNDPKAHEKYLKAVRKTTLKNLVTVARKYLVPNTISATALTNDDPGRAKNQLSLWQKNYQKAYAEAKKKTIKFPKAKAAKKTKSGKTKSAAQETRLIELKNGVRILSRPNFETQVLSAKVAFLGGSRKESADLGGLCEMTSRVWLGGTKEKTEAEIYQLIESMAAGINPVAGRNSIGLGLDALAPHEDEARELFLETLFHPTFPQEVVDRERVILLEQLKSRNDNPSQITIRQFMELIFPKHPYGRDMMGTPESVNKIQASDIQKFWKEHIVAKNMTVVLSGAFDEKKWVSEIEKWTADLPVGESYQVSKPIEYPTKPAKAFYPLQKEQSHLVYGYPGLKITDNDRFTLQVIQSILAGQGGRLFIELRDKQSLAYSVSPLKMEGLDGGYFGAYIGCSPDKAAKALELMNIEFQKLCDTKVPSDELERAQRYLAGRHDIDLQRVSAIATSILYDDIYGIPYNETFKIAEKFWAVTAEDIQRLARKIFSQKPVTSLVGPADPL